MIELIASAIMLAVAPREMKLGLFIAFCITFAIVYGAEFLDSRYGRRNKERLAPPNEREPV